MYRATVAGFLISPIASTNAATVSELAGGP
jgi:hypothetical protein